MRPIDYFDKAVDLFGSRAALGCLDGSRLTYDELHDRTCRVASALWEAGLRRGDKVAVYSPNHEAFIVCALSAMRCGAVWCAVNTRNAPDESRAYIESVRPAWVFYHSSVAADARVACRGVVGIRGATCIDATGQDPASLDAFAARAKAVATEWDDPYGAPDDTVSIVQSGGTTGAPSTITVSNLAWSTIIETFGTLMHVPDGDMVCLSVAPLTHAAGIMAISLLAIGAEQIVDARFDPARVLAAIERRRVTHLFLPPTALTALLDDESCRRYDYSSLKFLVLGGAPVSSRTLCRAVNVFGPCVCQTYGQVETGLLTWLSPSTVGSAVAGDHPERLSSCGRPVPSVRIRILDDAGGRAAPGQVGEVAVRSRQVSRACGSEPSRCEGWHRTGDLGYVDVDGYVYLVDRARDVIVSGGFNVHSRYVEQCLLQLPTVADCAVIGVPDEKWGEAVKAIVVPASRESPPSPEALIAHCKTKLGSVYAPKTVDIWEALPKTNVGKLDKKTVRARYWTGQPRNIA